MSSHSLSGEIWTLFVAIAASIDQKNRRVVITLWISVDWCRIFPLRTIGTFSEWEKQIVLLWFINPNLWRFHLSLRPHWDRMWKVFKSSSTCSLSLPLIRFWAKLSRFVYIFGVLHEISYSWVSQAVVWPRTSSILMAVPMHLNACGMAKPYTRTPPLIFLPVHNVV